MDHTLEILLMLLVAFLLGLLLGYILWYKWRKMYLDLTAEHDRLKALHLNLEKDHASLRYRCEELERDNHNLRDKVMHLESDVAAWKAKLALCEENLNAAVNSSLGYPGAETSRSAASAEALAFVAPTPISPDDLKMVEGIGPKIEKLCNDAGIWTFRQLAETAVERLRQILDDAGPAYKIADPSTWPTQAEMAANGAWEKLKEYQEFLIGGKNPE